jgi:hypothetical protein
MGMGMTMGWAWKGCRSQGYILYQYAGFDPIGISGFVCIFAKKLVLVMKLEWYVE